MDRQYYLDHAASGLKMPIGTHLVLHEHADHAIIPHDGRRLGAVIEEAARRFGCPMGLPLMDLKLEKEALLLARGIPAAEIDTFHFTETPAEDWDIPLTRGMEAVCEAVHHIASETDLLPVGMGIGPFSLMTKLVTDPITPVFLAGDGSTADDEEEVALLERLLDLASKTIRPYLAVQIQAGAKAIILCEPAANKVCFPPNRLDESYDVFDRYVMRLNQEIRSQLAAAAVDLIFHNCGELSDQLLARMREVDHPFILGSECDVLSVPGYERTIQAKVQEFLKAE